MPGVWWRHPADRVHHRPRADPEDPDTPRRTARASARLSRPRPADRLGRTRAGAQRPRHDSSVTRRTACDRHPQLVTPAERQVTTKPSGGRTRRDSVPTPENHHFRGESRRSGSRFWGPRDGSTRLTSRSSTGRPLAEVPLAGLCSKFDAFYFESGPKSLTRQVLARGKTVLLVGRNGRGYSPTFWPVSATFRQGTQTNLLIADGQTRVFDKYVWSDRYTIMHNTFGDPSMKLVKIQANRKSRFEHCKKWVRLRILQAR